MFLVGVVWAEAIKGAFSYSAAASIVFKGPRRIRRWPFLASTCDWSLMTIFSWGTEGVPDFQQSWKGNSLEENTPKKSGMGVVEGKPPRNKTKHPKNDATTGGPGLRLRPACGHGSTARTKTSEHPNPTTKIGSKMGGDFTYQPKWDPIGFHPQPCCHGIRRSGLLEYYSTI